MKHGHVLRVELEPAGVSVVDAVADRGLEGTLVARKCSHHAVRA